MKRDLCKTPHVYTRTPTHHLILGEVSCVYGRKISQKRPVHVVKTYTKHLTFTHTHTHQSSNIWWDILRIFGKKMFKRDLCTWNVCAKFVTRAHISSSWHIHMWSYEFHMKMIHNLRTWMRQQLHIWMCHELEIYALVTNHTYLRTSQWAACLRTHDIPRTSQRAALF